MKKSFHRLDVEDVLIGVGLGLLAFLFGEGGNIILKKYNARQLSNSKLRRCDRFLLFYAICEVFAISSGVYALHFLSLSIYNCGAGFNILLVAGMSWYLLNEKINRSQILCILLLAGAMTAVGFTGDRNKPKNIMQTLANGGDTDPVVFFTVILSLEVIATFFLWKRYQLITKLNNDAERQLSLSSESESDTEESGTSIHPPVFYEKVITNIPGETYIERSLAIFGFSCLCAMQYFWMVICADILMNQITLLVDDKPVVMVGWVFLPVGVFSAVLFFCFMNMNLSCFRAIDVLPIYVAFQNVTNGIGSIAMFGSTPNHVVGYVLSLVFVFVFGLLYTALIDEKEFCAYAIYIFPCCFKKVEKETDNELGEEMLTSTPASKEKFTAVDLVIESDAIDLVKSCQ